MGSQDNVNSSTEARGHPSCRSARRITAIDNKHIEHRAMQQHTNHRMTSKRANTLTPTVGILLLGTSLLGWAAGQFPPPSAPNVPIMKSLAEIEPRTVISQLPCNIFLPGSYYLAGDQGWICIYPRAGNLINFFV